MGEIMLPENHKKIVEEIMFAASRIRSNIYSELGHLESIESVVDTLMPYISQSKMEDSPLITACGKYLEHPTGIGFYNIITISAREPVIALWLEIYSEIRLPEPNIQWALVDL